MKVWLYVWCLVFCTGTVILCCVLFCRWDVTEVRMRELSSPRRRKVQSKDAGPWAGIQCEGSSFGVSTGNKLRRCWKALLVGIAGKLQISCEGEAERRGKQGKGGAMLLSVIWGRRKSSLSTIISRTHRALAGWVGWAAISWAGM